LPFNQAKYSKFSPILPKEKLLPPAERWTVPAKESGLVRIEQRRLPFGDLKQRMSDRIHVASPYKLALLARTNEQMDRLAKETLLELKFKKPVTLQEFVRVSTRASSNIIGVVKNYMQDAMYELEAILASEAQRIHAVNEERKRAATHKSQAWKQESMDPRYTDSVRELSVVLNLNYETGLRLLYERSMAELTRHLQTLQEIVDDTNNYGQNLCSRKERISEAELMALAKDAALDRRVRQQSFQLELVLTFSKSSESVQLKPTPEVLTKELLQMLVEQA
jgi:hypothetical protein